MPSLVADGHENRTGRATHFDPANLSLPYHLQPHGMAGRLAQPMVRCGGGLDAHDARQQLLEERHDIAPLQLARMMTLPAVSMTMRVCSQDIARSAVTFLKRRKRMRRMDPCAYMKLIARIIRSEEETKREDSFAGPFKRINWQRARDARVGRIQAPAPERKPPRSRPWCGADGEIPANSSAEARPRSRCSRAGAAPPLG
jgi:hypothetical protein